MHKTKLHSATTIRFRRWSRMGYAVFCSLASSVSIGMLAVSVSDKTLEKSVGSLASNSFIVLSYNAIEDKEADDKLELEATLQQTKAISFIKISVDSAAACVQTIYNIIHRNG